MSKIEEAARIDGQRAVVSTAEKVALTSSREGGAA